MKIFDAKKIHTPLRVYPLFCSIYTGAVITLLAFAGRLSYFNFPLIGKIYIGVDFYLVPVLFYFQNVITEVYGYERCRQLNQISIVGMIFFMGYSYLTTLMPLPEQIANQDAFNMVASTYPRHFIAFIFALYSGAIVNQYIIAKLKLRWNGKQLWLRSIISVFTGDFVYQIIGSLISRFGVLHMSEIFTYDLLSYFYKLSFELSSVPIVYILSNYLKNLEEIDIYDNNANFNPFKIKL